MSSLISQVTPLTRGIIWLVKDEANPSHPLYADIDYLLDGLLTANQNNAENFSSRVIIGRNFNHTLSVLILKEIKRTEVQSFVDLVKKDLKPENDILIFDDTDKLSELKKELKEISSHIKMIQ